jgi:hypothetical protein
VEFIDTDHSEVALSFPLSGTKARKGKPQTPFPANLALVCTTRLVHVLGDVESPNAASSPGDIIELFDPALVQKRSVVIDMTHITLSFIDTETKKEDDNFSHSLMISTLATHIRDKAGLKYHLAELNNIPPTAGNTTVLIPKAFAFTTVVGKGAVPGALCMWISMSGDPDPNRGTDDDPNNRLRFTPNGKTEISPIPQGLSASIIFSQSTMWNYFLKVTSS